MYFNLEGKAIKRTPINSPYSYEPFVQWLGDYHKDKGHSVYSDFSGIQRNIMNVVKRYLVIMDSILITESQIK